MDGAASKEGPGSRRLPPEILEAARQAAAPYQVPDAVHPEDYIFWFIHDQATLTDKTRAPEEYFQSGHGAAVFVKELLAVDRVRAVLAGRADPGRPLSLLEFASGYGRVTRHFAAVLPEVAVTACDIHGQAVDFLTGIGLDACRSSHVPEDFQIGRRFDVIFVFSFFTHMPRSSWGRWLRALARHVAPGGVLIFTTHGEVSQGLMGVPALEEDGFFFHPVSEQADLETAEYGNTVTRFDYVHARVQESDLKLLQFRQAGAGHHDLYILYRDPGEPAQEAAPAPAARELLTANRRLADELEAVHRSTSWRITAPLRALSRALKGA